MKIKTKLILGLSTLPILIFLLIGISWFQLYSLNKMNDSSETTYELSFLVEEIHRKVKDQAISIRNIVIFNDQESIERELAIIQNESDSILQNIDFLEAKVDSPEQKKLVEDLKNTNEKFNDYKDELIELISSGKKEEAIQLINHSAQSIHDEIFQVNGEITSHFESQVTTTFTEFTENFKQQILIGSFISLIGIIIVTGFLFRSVWSLAIRLNKVSGVMDNLASGKADLSKKVEVKSNDEIDAVAQSFNRMVQSLEEQKKKEQDLIWVKSNIADITTSLSGKHDLESLSRSLLSKLAPLTDCCHAALYVKDADNQKNESTFKLLSSYAFNERKHLSNTFRIGEGLIGQAALEKTPIILTNVPLDYIQVQSSLREITPLNLYVLPIIFTEDVKAVLELASFEPFSPIQQKFLEEVAGGLGIILDSVIGRIQLAKILEETQVLMEEIQVQSEELQTQQEELRITNEELEEQTLGLRQSEEKLQLQQEELEQTNIELQEKAEILEKQNTILEQRNKEIEKARAELEEKAGQLALNSKYKSEFLANMSHELRTPLNSLLILSKLLGDNQNGNLSTKQVEYAKTIHSSGRDLLLLINDILDLAKVEAGKMKINSSKVLIKDLAVFLEKNFKPIANEKNLSFDIQIKKGLPEYIFSDEQRIQQVLKNLLSNAFKFTGHGGVTLEIDWSSERSMFVFSVADTGIGIPKEKQELIFEVFQQADGTTSRKFGGSGLGLSICREISGLLNGDIMVDSKEGKGSTFTFYAGHYLEEQSTASQDEIAVTTDTSNKKSEVKSDPFLSKKSKASSSMDKNENIKRLLIVDDDVTQRNSLMELIGNHNVIIKAVSNGAEALEELKFNQFDCMVLDLGLSDTTGFELLDKINKGSGNEHLRVFIYTGRDLTSKEEIFLKKYAYSIIIKDDLAPQRLKEELEMYLNSNQPDEAEDQIKTGNIKKISGLEGKKILVVDDDVRNVYALSSILECYGMKIAFAENGMEGLEMLEKQSDFDLVLMDIMMPEIDGYEAIRRLRAIPKFNHLPVIALTAKAMMEDREKCIEAGASDYIAKPVDPDQLISLIKVWLYPEEGNSVKNESIRQP